MIARGRNTCKVILHFYNFSISIYRGQLKLTDLFTDIKFQISLNEALSEINDIRQEVYM